MIGIAQAVRIMLYDRSVAPAVRIMIGIELAVQMMIGIAPAVQIMIGI